MARQHSISCCEKAIRSATLLSSPQSRLELADVFLRDKFDRYLSKPDRKAYLAQVLPRFVMVEPTVVVEVCRDMDDNKILALALAGEADIIITGDLDLLVLHPFHGIAILSPADHLALP